MVCSSGVGFDARLDGERLLFGFFGIYQGTAVLYDRDTGSLWLHLTGRCFEGPRAGRVLAMLPTGRHTTWAAWRDLHPDTDVMRPEPARRDLYFPREASRAGDPFLSEPFAATIATRDDRLPPHALVLGVVVGGRTRAYPYASLMVRETPVHEEVGEVPLVVLPDPEGRSAVAFDRRLDGRVLRFVREGPGAIWL